MDVVSLNVGGTVFTSQLSTLQSIPKTKLSSLSINSKEYNPATGWYFFDRNSRVFEGILDYYRTGELHFPTGICGAVIKRELDFWEIPLSSVSDCCYTTICDYNDSTDNMKALKSTFENQEMQFSQNQLHDSQLNKIRDYVWRFINYPKSSKPAMVFSIFYFVFIVLPIITFVLGTHEAFRESYGNAMISYENENQTFRFTLREFLLHDTGNPKIAFMSTTVPKAGIVYIEGVCTVLFGIELIIRFVCCPQWYKLLKCPLQYIDYIVFISSLIAFCIEVTHDYHKLFWVYVVSKFLVILRSLRMIHLTRHIGGLRVLMLALRSSVKELFLLLLSFVSLAVFFSGIVYYAEFYEPDTFKHMPITLWWSIVTMTTVGYGDYTPSTFIGYTVASICALTGVLIISMPVAVITANFSEFYKLNKIRVSKQENAKDTRSEQLQGNKSYNKVHAFNKPATKISYPT